MYKLGKFIKTNVRIVCIAVAIVVGAGVCFVAIKPNNEAYAGWGTCVGFSGFCAWVVVNGGTFTGTSSNKIDCPSWVYTDDGMTGVVGEPHAYGHSCWDVTSLVNIGASSLGGMTLVQAVYHCHQAGLNYPGSIGTTSFTLGTHSKGAGSTLTTMDVTWSGPTGQDLGLHIMADVPPPAFQPGTESLMAQGGRTDVYDLTSGPQNITDSFKSTEETPSWNNFPSTNVTFTPSLLGPFPTIMFNSNSTSWPNTTYPQFSTTSSPATITFSYSDYSSGVWKSTTFQNINRGGYYYGVARLSGSNYPDTIINMDWKTGAIHSTEMAYAKFQPYVESNVQQTGQRGTYLAGTIGTYRTFDPGDTVTNRVVARATNSITKADNLTPTNYAETPSAAGWFNDNIWPNGNMPLRVCVDVYGPYQQPQAQNLDAAPAGAPKIDSMTKCQDFQRPGAAAGDYRDFTFTAPSEPGYYYFMERIEKGAGAEGQTADTDRLIISRWTSKFNPSTRDQDEKFVVRFQPIAESDLVGNRNNQNNTDKGAIFDCTENKIKLQIPYNNEIPGVSKFDNLPPDKVTCEDIKDKIYIGATDKRDIGGDIVNKQFASEKSWLKDASGNYEIVNFRVKLYGPFATPEARTPGSPAAGKTIQTVPYQPVGTGTPSFISAYSQPAAMTDLISASNGPRWDLLNNAEDLHYEVTFKQDANGGTAGALTTTSLRLSPGFYVAVVEILRSDNGPIPTTSNPASASGNLFTGNSDNGDRIFFSAWGDPYESLSIPLPVYAWSLRSPDWKFEFNVGDVVDDTIWIKGFDPSEWVIPRPGQDPVWQSKKDALGRDMVMHTALNFDNKGTNYYGYDPASTDGNPFRPGYFAPDTKANISVTLYGPYDSMPTDDTRETFCEAYDPNDNEDMVLKKVAKRWNMPSSDFRNGTKLPGGGHKIMEEGWYVFFIEFTGGDRVYPFSSKCNDQNEIFHAGGETIIKEDPKLTTQIKPSDSDKPVAPIVITDTVNITVVDPQPSSIVRLTLFKRVGSKNDIAVDTKLCMVEFKVSKMGQFTTKNYIETDGTVKDGNGDGKCFAETGGFYYWYEEFIKPGGKPYHPGKPGGPGEEVTIKDSVPKITTKAQPTAKVKEPFGDIAIVSGIPASNTKKYKIVIEAFGPQKADGSKAVCEEPFFTWEKIITKNGSYTTDKTAVDKPGNVYWIEYLYVKNEESEDGFKLIASGKCGQPHETTRIAPETPPDEPESGAFVRNISLAIGFGITVAIAVLLLTTRRTNKVL